MYSGHTVMLTLCYLMVREYLLPYRLRTLHSKLANLLMFSFSCTGVICVIISRGHYLIDILVAYYVTTRVFWIYHTMAHNQLMMVSVLVLSLLFIIIIIFCFEICCRKFCLTKSLRVWFAGELKSILNKLNYIIKLTIKSVLSVYLFSKLNYVRMCVCAFEQ